MAHLNEIVDPSLARELEQAGTEGKADVLFAYMERRGQSFYDEAVTQLEHALQCANEARLSGADDVLVTGALLHDLGHFWWTRETRRPTSSPRTCSTKRWEPST